MGNEIFAVQNGGECWTTANARETYDKYGVADNCCSQEGTGGTFCQDVYEIGTVVNMIILKLKFNKITLGYNS